MSEPRTTERTVELDRPTSNLITYGWYPALAVIGIALAVAAIQGSIERAAAAGIFGALVVFGTAIVEWRHPLDRRWRMTGRSFFHRDLPYLGIDLILERVGEAIAALIAVSLLPADGYGPLARLPLLAQAFVGLALFDLCWYHYHRLAHTNDRLWRVHGAHHSPSQLYVFMHGVFHPFDVIVIRVVITVAVFGLSGITPTAGFIALLVMALQGTLSHANIDLRVGPINYLLMGNQTHRYHHSADHQGNYSSVLTMWDLLFGTFLYRPDAVPERIGLRDPTDYPDPEHFHQVLAWPLVRADALPQSELDTAC